MRHGFRFASAGLAVVLLAGAAFGQADFRPRFRAAPPFAVTVGAGAGRQALALGDVDGDARPDLVAVAPAAEAVYLHRNDGSAAFGAPASIAVGIVPTSVAIADLTAPQGGAPDGIADLLVGGSLGELAVVPGRGAGAFDPLDVVRYDALGSGAIVGFAVLDLDGVGGADVALLDAGGLRLLCNQAGALAPCGDGDVLRVGEDPIEILSGDFDADGRADLVVLDRAGQLVFPFYGLGAGAVRVANPVPVRGEASEGFAVDMAVGRVDDDASDDIVIANFDQNFQFLGIALLGGTRLRALSFVIDFQASSVALGDFDVDGVLDAIVGYSDSGLTINVGEAGGSFYDPFAPVGSNTIGEVGLLASADLNGDRVPDLLVVDRRGASARVLVNLTGAFCGGDCNADGQVTIDELTRGVNIALGLADRRECPAADVDGDGVVAIHELIGAVDRALGGCPMR